MKVMLDACHGRPTPHTPIWLMRQAGRYQPEYRAIREKVGFLELCRNPELVTEVTLLPVTQFNFDAAIIFADILLILEALGLPFHFAADHGPKIEKPVRSNADIDALAAQIDPVESLGFVLEAMRMVRSELPKETTLLGFAGAPFTLASYMIEGSGSRNYLETKRMMYNDPSAWNTLMDRITAATSQYLLAQIEAGADAVQVFDSWVGCLDVRDYQRFVSPHMHALFASLRGKAPVIHFGTGNPALYCHMAEAGGDVLGVDWRVDLDDVSSQLRAPMPMMGNLDPTALIAPPELLTQKADVILRAMRGRIGHIFNLGHGILPQTSPDQVRRLVDHVHGASATAT